MLDGLVDPYCISEFWISYAKGISIEAIYPEPSLFPKLFLFFES